MPDLRRQFEVKVFAQVAVTQAVLPQIRAATGRVVFISSNRGPGAGAMEGAYCASKFAIEGIADVLRVELRQWHIQVSVVEPGPTDTGSRRCSTTWSRVCRPATASSTRPTSAASSSLSAPCSPGTVPPDVVARVVEEGLTARRPRARYAAGVQARAMVTMNAVLPTRLNDAIGGRLIGLR